MRVSKLNMPKDQSALTAYAVKLAESIFALQSTTFKVKKWIKGMNDMAKAMHVTTYMINRAIKQAHRNLDYSSKPLELSFRL